MAYCAIRSAHECAQRAVGRSGQRQPINVMQSVEPSCAGRGPADSKERMLREGGQRPLKILMKTGSQPQAAGPGERDASSRCSALDDLLGECSPIRTSADG